ncbi:MAG: PQQ-dependent sugar dehydrogenase [Gemmatimonadaceae bacterium]
MGRDTARADVWTPVIAPSGALFYSGAMFNGWRGSALVGGLSSQSLIRLQLDGDRVAMEERVFMGRVSVTGHRRPTAQFS